MALVGSLVVLGCASGSGGDTSAFEDAGRSGPQDVRVLVDNQNFNQATIYAIWGAGGRVRLGIVNSQRSEEFVIPWRSADIKMEIRLLSAGTYETYRQAVAPGDYLELILTATMDRYRAIR